MSTNLEWLYSLQPDELTAWFDAEHEANDDLPHENDVSAADADANDGFMDLDSCTHGMRTFASETDSREKLEADARALQTRIWRAGANSDGISLTHIIELLDRQAAITERELCKQCDWPSLAAQPDLESQERIAELTAERDKLQHEKVKLIEANEDYREAMFVMSSEREKYRELFSKAITQAAEIVNLQP